MIGTLALALAIFGTFHGTLYAYSKTDEIKKNWPMYRCNPTYMFMADDISENFEYCLQQTSTATFGNLSKSLTDMQSQGFSLQSITAGNISSLLKTMNASNSNIGFSFTSLLNKSGAINVLVMSIMSVFTDILGKLGQIIASTGGMMNSGTAGLSIVNNEFSKYMNMLS